METIDQQINKIGENLIHCTNKRQCVGIKYEPRKGIIPRGLFLEKIKGGNGAVVIGINPGHARLGEKEKMKNNKSYKQYKEFFSEKILPQYKYHYGSKKLIEELGFKGTILWTELVKCESKKKKKIPIQTMRLCINKHLIRELNLVKKWPIIALGNTAFEFCSLRFPDRQVIGIPHPSGRSRMSHEVYKKIDGKKEVKINKKELRHLKEYCKLKRKFKNKPFAIKLF